MDSRPAWTTETISLSRRRTSALAFLTALLNRLTNRSRIDDRHEINEDAERGRRHEVLHLRDIVRDRTEEYTRLVRIVVIERKSLEVVVHSQAEVVGHPLSDALGVIVVDVGGKTTDRRDEHHAQRGDRCERSAVSEL
jgi:hypothetical protein